LLGIAVLQRGDDVADIDGRSMSSAWLALASIRATIRRF
jgi:hypothetical protein